MDQGFEETKQGVIPLTQTDVKIRPPDIHIAMDSIQQSVARYPAGFFEKGAR